MTLLLFSLSGQVLIDWINDVLVGERIIVKDLAEDLYDGQVLQKLFGKRRVECRAVDVFKSSLELFSSHSSSPGMKQGWIALGQQTSAMYSWSVLHERIAKGGFGTRQDCSAQQLRITSRADDRTPLHTENMPHLLQKIVYPWPLQVCLHVHGSVWVCLYTFVTYRPVRVCVFACIYV